MSFSAILQQLGNRLGPLARRVIPEETIAKVDARRRDLSQISQLRLELDALRSRMDIGDAIAEQFEADRRCGDYRQAFEKPEPLVTVCVGTYNRGEIVAERCVRSILAQSYRNLQVIVIGDACTDDTESRFARMRDTRIHFENLSERGVYPEVRLWKWMVAGTVPVNRALALADGDFITHLDDDDEYASDRVEKLLETICRVKADLVYHPFWNLEKGAWKLNPASKFQCGHVTTGSVLYHKWFRRIPWDLNAYRYNEPGDANRFRKFRFLGVDAVRNPEPLLRKY